jgi:hypothetical protein
MTKQSRREMSTVTHMPYPIIIAHYPLAMGNLNLNGHGECVWIGKDLAGVDVK